MKKILLVLLSLVFLITIAGCSNQLTPEKETNQTEDTNDSEKSNAPDKASEKGSIKDDAIEVDFVKLNGGEIKEGTVLHLVGEVGAVFGDKMFDKFSLTTEEGGGYGMYTIENFAQGELEYKEGDQVEIWGEYSGKADDGMPLIKAFIIEEYK